MSEASRAAGERLDYTGPLPGYHAFWFGFAVSRAKLVLFRVCFFAMVGLDAFLQIQHAPRYGAGDFNVTHVPWLDWALPMPSREGMLFVFLVQCYLAFRIAFGSATRTSVRLLAGLYGYAYFISQLDSYQHHYLVFLLLVVCSFVPWDAASQPAASNATGDGDDRTRPARKDPKKDQKTAQRRTRAAYEGREVYSWAIRLIYVQLAIVYAWAAMSKLGPAWFDGTTLQIQIQEPWARNLIETMFGEASRADPGGFSIAAKIVIVTELTLAVFVLWRRLWIAALPIGVAFHLGVEFAGLRIGLFSYLMCAVYVLMVPEWLLAWIAQWVAGPVSAATNKLQATIDRLASSAAVMAAIAVGSSALLLLPYEPMSLVMLVCTALAIIAAIMAYRRAGTITAAHRAAVVHLVVCLLILCLHYKTEQSFNHYKYWAGSARRLGPPEAAREAYTKLTTLHPEYGPGHYHLGNIYAKEEQLTKALAAYGRAIDQAPDDYRPHLGQALIYMRARQPAQAYEAATRALELEPDNDEAKQIQKRFSDHRQSVPDAP